MATRNYGRLMRAAENFGLFGNLKAEKKSTISISLEEWLKATKNQEHVGVIELDCYLDTSLENFLKLIFMRWNKEVRNQFNPEGGSLVSLTHKARLIYSLGYIDETILDDLKQIHKIRNHFAHNVKMAFTDTKVCKLVSKLSVVKDSKVTTKNKYSIYLWTVDKCIKAINAGMAQEIIRKSVLKQFEKQQSQQATI